MPDNALRLPEAIIASVHTPTPKTEGTATIGRPTARDLTLADLTSTAEALHDISGFTRAKSPDGKARWTNSIQDCSVWDMWCSSKRMSRCS